MILNVLENVIVATSDVRESQYLPPNYYYASGFGRHRSHSYPVSLGRHQLPQKQGHRQKTKCKHCSAKSERRRKALSDDSAFGLIGRKMVVQSSK